MDEADKPTHNHSHGHGPIGRFFAGLGPGLITGAADDDPSGISTYSVTGAAFGYGQLWTVLLSFPMMAAVQLMCARLGLVTGHGLAGVIRRRYSRSVLWFSCVLLVVANVVNIGADLKGMAEAMEMMTAIPSLWWMPIFAGGIVAAMVFSSYRHIAKVFKWLTMVLLAYIVTAFFARPDWGAVLHNTFVPHIELSTTYIATFVGILGTTISPYLFFWQAAQEVEEERASHSLARHRRFGAGRKELIAMRNDVLTGMAFAGLIMYFIILTTGATLHAHGITNIETARQAAEALRPLAGDAAYLLFTIGIVGTGMLGVPVLAGSAAFAVAEGMAWNSSLDARPRVAPKFYAVFTVAVLAGVSLDWLGISAVRMLFIAAVLNGLLAPPLVAIVTLLTSDPKVMGTQTSSPLVRRLGWITTGVMGIAGIVLLVLLIIG